MRWDADSGKRIGPILAKGIQFGGGLSNLAVSVTFSPNGKLLAAGMYGILEGWLAVDGARDWWPMRPPPERDEPDFGWASDDLMLPGVFDVYGQDEVGERTPLHRGR